MPGTPQLSVALIFGLLLAGTVAGALLRRWPRLCGWVCAVFVAAAAAASGWLGAIVYGSPEPVELTVSRLGTPAASLTLHLTRLNMIFVWLVLGLGLAATVFSVRYVERSARKHPAGRPVLRYYPLLMLFLGSMAAVVCISDLLFFFIAWSLMSLTGLLLIVHEYHRPEVLQAGFKFFVFTLVGNTAILVAILLLYREGGDFSFATARTTMASLLSGTPVLAHVIFGLFALGFLTKLGIYPMGDWLPDAHPAAPSPVSALLSGVMIKLAAYDIAHNSIELLAGGGAGPDALMAWGVVLLALGALSVLLAGAAAAANNDTKRLLAYSSVSQSGYILMCLAVCIAFVGLDARVSALAFVAALAFVIADGLHKSLLFLTAGSVLHATDTRDMVHLGGLGERMPSTAAAAIAGGLSLGGIPLTAGFIAKWLLLQAAVLGAGQQPALAVCALVVVVGSILAMAYALKYVGATYLGAPADPECCRRTEEVPASMRGPQVALALGILATGVWPALMTGPALAAWQSTVDGALPLAGMAGGALPGDASPALVGGFIPPVILVLVAVAGLLAWGLSRVAGAPSREVPSWQSGLNLPLARTRLPASGWYWPFTPLLRSVYREINLPDITGLVGGDEAEPEPRPEREAADRVAATMTSPQGD